MHMGQSIGRWQGLGTKLALTNFFCVLAIVALLVGGVAWGVQQAIQTQTENDLRHSISIVKDMVASNDQDLRTRTKALADSFASTLQGTIERESVAGGPAQLKINGEVLNGDIARMERYTRLTGAVATVFMKEGADYVRITTSLRNEQGKPAVGTKLDPQHPAFALLNNGQSYMGLAKLFGKEYMTHYEPLRDPNGAVVGVVFIGQDFSQLLAQLKSTIRQMKVGESGYYYVLHNAEKAPRGTLAVHPALEGQNILDSQDSKGRPFVREILEKKQGSIRYPWSNPQEQNSRDKLAVFDYYAPWDWMIVASAYDDDFIATTRTLMWAMAAMGALAVLALSGMWLALVQRMIVRPLSHASAMAHALATGDLTVSSRHHRRDELGQLLSAMNATAAGLNDVVRTVQARAQGVATASTDIAHSNSDLAQRTENTAGALEETAAAMEELGGTVSRNAEHAHAASELTHSAQRVVLQSGDAVRQVVQTMQGIDASSKKIADIIGVIDSIAFQTNILALNAAVEAARAGENGRGFAVVAGEVRQLASRSAEAAKEIKQLISSSVRQIEEGNTRVAYAGDAMAQAIAEIEKVTQLMGSISHASAEQRTGVAQVAEAVSHMDHTTQKNAALVQKTSSAAESLRQQSAQLLDAVRAFRVVGGVEMQDQSLPHAQPTTLPPAQARVAPSVPVPRSASKALPRTQAAQEQEWASF